MPVQRHRDDGGRPERVAHSGLDPSNSALQRDSDRIRLLRTIAGEDWDDDEAKARHEEDALEESTRFFTAAAAEGLNLQKYCRYLIHWEIPWNPDRMELRTGRVFPLGLLYLLPQSMTK